MSLVLERVRKEVGAEVQLRDVSLALDKGSLNVLLGATLAGKTSLMRLMAGLDAPSSGRVLADGADVTGRPVRRRNVAMVYQQFINYPSLTVLENIASPLRVAGLPAAEIERRVRDAAGLLRLEPYLARRPLELSGGQQQRTAIARALVKRAHLVLLDEPLANLDYKLREELREELPRIFAESGAVFVYATTEPSEALLLGGNTATLFEGRVTQFGPTAEVYRQPRDLRTAEVFSDPPLNTLGATKSGGTVALATGASLRATGPFGAVPDGAYTVGFRAYHLSLDPLPGVAEAIALPATVSVAEITGSESYVHLDVGSRRFVALVPGVRRLEPGSAVTAYLDPRRLFLFDEAGRFAAADLAQAAWEGHPMAQITLDRLAHAYKPDPQGPADYALREVDHVWRQGGAYALLGPSGCGKTTLLNIISGLVVPTRGRLLFDERDVTALPTEARNIAQVFQFPVVYDTMTVGENLAFPLRNRGVPREAAAARVAEIAGLLDLTPVLGRKARNLTADLKQKISLGRGLVRPDVAAILFDEPLTVIDPHLKWQLRSTLKELHQRLDLTMIYVTHDQTEALTFADTVVVMHDGAVVQTGTPEELFDRPAHTFVGHFIGSPGMNVLPCRIEGATAFVEGHAIPLSRAYPDLSAERRIELGIRPEFSRLLMGGKGVPVQVRRIDDIGRRRIARVELAGRALAASLDEASPGGIAGSEAAIAFDPDRIHVYADGRLVAGEPVGRGARP